MEVKKIMPKKSGYKTKLLYYGDINLKTGFGQIADKIIPGLFRTGLYDIVALGVNYHGEPHKYPCHIYPIDSSDVYGVNIFPRVLQREKPDIIFALQDLFILKELVKGRDMAAPGTPIVGYFPIDGNNIPDDWAECILKLDMPITYSEYARKLIHWRIPTLGRLEMIYHGIDTNVFKILSIQEREAKRAALGWTDHFVVGVFNRFQPRKLVPLIIRAFSLFRQGYKKCKGCGNYYHITSERCDLNLCDAGFEIYPGHEDAKIYLHMNIEEPMMGGHANDLPKSFISAQLYDKDSTIYIPGVDIYGEASPDAAELVRLYNACDVYVSGTVGEGFGLTGVEALSCGLPVIVPANTTAPELFQDRAEIIKSAGFVNMPFDSGHHRPVFDVPSMVDALNKVYTRWRGEGYRPNWENHYFVRKNHNWGEIVGKFHALIQEAKRNRDARQGAVNLEVF